MGRRRRKIESKQCYEVCFRAREGLPLVPYHLINLMICSVLARAQRDGKVDICHDIWNGSHAHMLLIARDAEMFVKFLGEVQKQITEVIKRLLGLDYLNIWEGTPTIAKVLDIDMAVDRISYFYANPGQDNLVDSIERFPGVSSWQDFLSAEATIAAECSKDYAWIRLPTVPLLVSPVLSPEQDWSLAKFLKKANKTSHPLIRTPNLWMKCFGVTNGPLVAEINARILKRLRKREQLAREKRKAEGKSVMGEARLTSQPIMKSHKPKKHERKIFCLSSVNELRTSFIAEFKAFCKRCQECYEQWRLGNFAVEWPPGAFRPPLRPAYNILPSPSAGHFEYL